MSHFTLMVAYALLISSFFALLWRRERREQWKLFAQLFFGLVVGAIVLAWLMFPFPAGPPQPIQ
jgi:uncharacterized membrane protein YfcA